MVSDSARNHAPMVLRVPTVAVTAPLRPMVRASAPRALLPMTG
jgi:hypothetical protein